jgi:uncharacterized protein (TIGR02246 family)
MLLLGIAAAAGGAPPRTAAGGAAQNPSKEERAIRSVVARWQQDWNRHDFAAVGDLLAVDADYVTDAGVWLRGRQQFIDWHAKQHSAMYRNSSWTNNEATFRFLQPEIAILHLTWGRQGDLDAKGALRPGRPGISTWLLVKISGHWKIRTAQNTSER